MPQDTQAGWQVLHLSAKQQEEWTRPTESCSVVRQGGPRDQKYPFLSQPHSMVAKYGYLENNIFKAKKSSQ